MITMLEVLFPERDDPEPAILVFGVEEDGQRQLVDSLVLGPFPDWEGIALRVMRHTIRCGRRQPMY